MCMFSGPVEHVSGTSIFARFVADGRQVVVYQMRMEAAQEVAMVLPLPVRPGAGDEALEFVDLEGYADLFDDVASGFPAVLAPLARGRSFGPEVSAAPRLVVHDVGAFEASYVPSLADFTRLDPRFVLPDGVWEALPGYADFGFAVFKLRPRKRGLLRGLFGSGGPQTIHPMAFLFPSRADRLFFPTVHVHDGTVEPQARFDHTLYCQVPRSQSPDRFTGIGSLWWARSGQSAGSFVEVPRARGVFDEDEVVFRGWVFGDRPNTDAWVGARRRRDRALLEAVVSAVAPDAVAERLACLDSVEYPGWVDAQEMKLAFVKLSQTGFGTLESLVVEPHAQWNPLRSRALRPRALARDYPNLPEPERDAIDKADADEVDEWLTALIGP